MEKTKAQVIEELLLRFNGTVEALLGKAYDAGLLDGYEQARREIAAQILKVEPRLERKPVGTQPISRAKVENRAAPGSVRPAIETAMRDARRGLKTDEVLELVHKSGRTDIKANTVRGTLNTLKGKGITEKRGGLWFLIDTKPSSADTELVTNQKGEFEMDTRPH